MKRQREINDLSELITDLHAMYTIHTSELDHHVEGLALFFSSAGERSEIVR